MCPNSVYLCINHPNGDIALAVSCMEICEKLTPDVISTQMDFLNSCPYVVLDANLRADTLAYIAEHCHSALCADAVSVKKAERPSADPAPAHIPEGEPGRGGNSGWFPGKRF